MKIMWISNAAWASSGYGQQTSLTLLRLQALGHELASFNFYGLEGGILNINGVLQFPKGAHPYGNDLVVAHCASFKAEVLISLMDTWVMNPEEYPITLCWVPWYPVDHDPLPGIVRNKIAQAFKRIAFSKFGVKMTHDAGLDCYYIPFGLDLKVFCPGDKKEARIRLGLPQDKYIISTVAMNKGNPSRKNFPEMAQAFKLFKDKHPDAFWFLQTNRGENSNDMVNIPEMLYYLGLVENQDWGICNQYQNMIGFPPQYIADIYRSSDVMMLVSAGEGFGIPLLEAQACGCPVITGDWTANAELCLAGRKVDKKDAYKFYTGLASYNFKPRPETVAELLEEEFAHPSDTAQALETIKAEYDVDVLAQTKWKPILTEIQTEWETHMRATGFIK